MKELVMAIIGQLVDKPDEVDVLEEDSGSNVSLKLKVNADDLGKVIGKQGRTAKAIRTVLNAAGMKNGKRVTLDIVE